MTARDKLLLLLAAAEVARLVEDGCYSEAHEISVAATAAEAEIAAEDDPARG